ncbi:MAG: hypothetical protein ACOYOK_11780, partial [Pseudobdellovibrionaceae bacterium]
ILQVFDANHLNLFQKINKASPTQGEVTKWTEDPDNNNYRYMHRSSVLYGTYSLYEQTSFNNNPDLHLATIASSPELLPYDVAKKISELPLETANFLTGGGASQYTMSSPKMRVPMIGTEETDFSAAGTYLFRYSVWPKMAWPKIKYNFHTLDLYTVAIAANNVSADGKQSLFVLPTVITVNGTKEYSSAIIGRLPYFTFKLNESTAFNQMRNDKEIERATVQNLKLVKSESQIQWKQLYNNMNTELTTDANQVARCLLAEVQK